MKKIRFIINPIAGTGKHKKVETAINRVLDRTLFHYDIQYTLHPKHGIAISQDAIAENYDIVVAVGGDGTVNEVGTPLIGTNVTLAVIPTGSGNALARHLKISMNVESALKKINLLNIAKIDTAEMNSHKFIGVSGVGFDGYIAKLFSQVKKRGFRSYIRLVSKEVFKYKPEEYTIRFDGKAIIQKAFLICVANSSEYGNSAQIAPGADIKDGYLDLCIISQFPLIKTPVITLKLFNQTINTSQYNEMFKIKSVKISKQGAIMAHIDGEPVDMGNEIEIKINPLSLQIIE
jgi:YegS/Rv2252/BmrU family lipid kinase